jgi:gluconolactonase
MDDHLMQKEQFIPFAEGLDHPEGVAWGPDGFLYAGGEAGQIYRVSVDGEVTQVGSTGGFILGMAHDAAANVYACDLAHGAIMKITPAGHVSKYSDNAEPIPAPNYPVFDASGNLYFSSSGSWHGNNGAIYRAQPGGATEVVSRDFTLFPNGMALSPDGTYLYIVLSNKPGVERARIQPDGTLGPPEPVVMLERTVPDGLAFDIEGNLYISCYTPDRIYRLSPSGELRVLVEDWESTRISAPTNIAFGGAEMKTLFIASLCRWHLTKGELPVAGQRVHYPALH